MDTWRLGMVRKLAESGEPVHSETVLDLIEEIGRLKDDLGRLEAANRSLRARLNPRRGW